MDKFDISVNCLKNFLNEQHHIDFDNNQDENLEMLLCQRLSGGDRNSLDRDLESWLQSNNMVSHRGGFDNPFDLANDLDFTMNNRDSINSDDKQRISNSDNERDSDWLYKTNTHSTMPQKKL